MKILLALLLTMALTASAFAAAQSRARVCCASEDCSMVQCLEMGCLPVASPIAADCAMVCRAGDTVRERVTEPACFLPSHYKEIWTPPD